MSIVSSFVLVLLCFTFHAYNARTFGFVEKEQIEEIEQHSTSQENAKLNPDGVSTQPDNTKYSVESAKPEITSEEKIKGNNESIDPGTKSNDRVRVSDTARDDDESREAISFKVPHEKIREPEVPGFNLDYLPPRTHPPAHN